MTELHLLSDSFYGIPSKTPGPPAAQPKPTSNFWRPAETPGPISALEKHMEIIDSSEKISSHEENIDGEQNMKTVGEEDETSRLYRPFFHQIKRFQPTPRNYLPMPYQPQYFYAQPKPVVRRTVITETICQTGNYRKFFEYIPL